MFVVFSKLALQGFGGVLPVTQRVLCEERGWLTRTEFAETLALAQLLPGPNVCNLALMIGDRHFGTRGALAALAGMLVLPFIIVVALAAVVGQSSTWPWVSDALRGMGLAASGLLVGTGLKLASGLRGHPLGAKGAGLIVMLVFGLVVGLRWPLAWVLGSVAPLSIGLCWWRLRGSRGTA